MSTTATEDTINPMQMVRLSKVVLHISVGNNWERLQKAIRLLEHLTEQKPVTRIAKKTIRAFGIIKKDPMSCLVTLRGEQAEAMLEKVLEGVGIKVKRSSFDRSGNFAFGIGEHLDIPGIKYDPTIGIFGMDVAVHLVKPGHRVRLRKYRRSRLGKRGTVTRREAEKYLQERFGVELT